MDNLVNSFFKHYHVRKANFFLVGVLLFLLSCKNLTEQKSNLPKSSGKFNEVSVVIEDNLWNGIVGDSLRLKLAHPIVGLTTEEPNLVLSQFSPKILNNLVQESRNLVVIKQGNESEFLHVENEYAVPQNVFYISGQTIDDILELISIHGEVLESSVRFYELLEKQREITTHPFNDKRLQEEFGISLLIPYQYRYALINKDFLWVKKDIPTGSSSILIYETPISKLENEKDFVQNFVRVRDSITQKFIKGVNQDSHMLVDKGYSPYFKKFFYNEYIDSYEFRGTWDLTNDFMEGPYMTYLFKDDLNNRYLFVDGFVYNPSHPKRDLMFELEAIIKSIYFIEK